MRICLGMRYVRSTKCVTKCGNSKCVGKWSPMGVKISLERAIRCFRVVVWSFESMRQKNAIRRGLSCAPYHKHNILKEFFVEVEIVSISCKPQFPSK